jgi:hypothetical protein
MSMASKRKAKTRPRITRAQRKLVQAIWTEAFIEYWNSLPEGSATPDPRE